MMSLWVGNEIGAALWEDRSCEQVPMIMGRVFDGIGFIFPTYPLSSALIANALNGYAHAEMGQHMSQTMSNPLNVPLDVVKRANVPQTTPNDNDIVPVFLPDSHRRPDEEKTFRTSGMLYCANQAGLKYGQIKTENHTFYNFKFNESIFTPLLKNAWPSPMSLSPDSKTFWENTSTGISNTFTADYFKKNQDKMFFGHHNNGHSLKSLGWSEQQFVAFMKCTGTFVKTAGSGNYKYGKPKFPKSKHTTINGVAPPQPQCISGQTKEQCISYVIHQDIYGMTTGTNDLLYATSHFWGIMRAFALLLILAVIAFTWEFVRNSAWWARRGIPRWRN